VQYYKTNQLAIFGATGSPPSGALAIFYPNVTLAVCGPASTCLV
jgi:hypothetical protein